MKKGLKPILKEQGQLDALDSVIGTYDLISDIAVLRVPGNLKARTHVVAKAILQAHKNVKTILLQVGGVGGEFRLRRLDWVMGERKTQTVHREWGCTYRVDLETCYFSPRLSYERMRVARLVKPGETVANMFAGVGCFSVLMVKLGRSQIVYSIDVNSSATECLQENARLNRVEAQVVSIQGDAKEVVAKHLSRVADRVVMPLPEKAVEYLDLAVIALKPTGGWIHYYDFEHASKDEDPVEKVKVKVSGRLRKLGIGFTVSFGRVVRPTGPYWYQVVLDIQAF